MAVNLLETIQQNLGYPPLQKIDPNTEKVTDDPKTPDEHKFSQAAIPAVLTAFYKYVQSDDGAEEFLRGDSSTDWVSKIFPDNTKEALQKICSYGKQAKEDPVSKINAIAHQTVAAVKKELTDKPAGWDVKVFFNNQKNTILLYLPPALHLGDLLHDETLDDNTNKMEGPISSLMHNIGSAFSQPVTGQEIKKT